MSRILIILLCFLSACISKKHEAINRDALSLVEFKNKTIERTSELNKGALLDDSLCIELIKISNTINYYSLNGKQFEDYDSIFLNSYLQKIVTRLDCRISGGMGYDCPKYGVSVGGFSWFQKGSFFEIDSTTLPIGTILPSGKKVTKQ